MTCVFIKVTEAMYKLGITTDQWTSKALGEKGTKRGTGGSTKCRIIPTQFGLEYGHDDTVTWLSQYQALQFCPKAAVYDDGAHPDFPAFPTEIINCDISAWMQ